MTQVPTVPTATSTVPGARLAAGARNVADVHGAPVEASSAQVGVSFNESAFLYQGGGQRLAARNDHPSQQDSGLITPPSQTFAAMFELQQTGERRRGDPARRDTRGQAELRARAINTYRTNVKVTSGESDVRGGFLSLNL